MNRGVVDFSLSPAAVDVRPAKKPRSATECIASLCRMSASSDQQVTVLEAHSTQHAIKDVMNKKLVVGATIFGVAVASAAMLGGRFNPGRGETREWYRELEKPSFNPPDFVFAPAWTALYILIAISGYRVWSCDASRVRTVALALWSAQLMLNALWSPLFFGAKKPAIALGDVLLMLGAIASYTVVARNVDKPAAWLMLPYLAWVAFATLLNAEIVRLND